MLVKKHVSTSKPNFVPRPTIGFFFTGCLVNVEVTEAFKMRGCRELVYRLACSNLGYYSTPEHAESILYDGTTPAVRIAFASRDMGRRFYNELKSWDGIAGVTVVQPLNMESYSGGLLNNDTIFKAGYNSKDSDSSKVSRISVQSSILSFKICRFRLLIV